MNAMAGKNDNRFTNEVGTITSKDGSRRLTAVVGGKTYTKILKPREKPSWEGGPPWIIPELDDP